MSFEWPKIYNFPPFFTKQPNEQTWEAQRTQWTQLILSYCNHYKVWIINDRGVPLSKGLITDDDPDESTDLDEPDLFHNKQIDRKLDIETIQLILSQMAQNGDLTRLSGQYYVNWKRPEDWGALILEWCESTGQTGSVLTLYEISNGDMSMNQEFYGIHPKVLEMALTVLVQRGRAQLMKDGGQVVGVKVQ
jgi:ESCRT-II complex subunit VPS25